MSKYWQGLIAACSGVAFLAIGGMPEPAYAQLPLGLFFRGVGPHYGGCGRHCYRRGSGSSDTSDDSGSSPRDRIDRAAMLAKPSAAVENVVLTKIAELNASEVGSTQTEVGTTKDVNALGKATSTIWERDWPSWVTDIASQFERAGRSNNLAGDVTQHGIEQALDGAIKSAKLDTYATFLNENWTPENLRVKVLVRVRNEVSTLFNGNSKGLASMAEVDKLIQRAAQSTYRRIFEVSELMAANRSSSLFTQHLYQAHGDLVDDQLRDSFDAMLTHISNEAVRKFETAFRQDPNGYALRYRAQRIVFDCLTENVDNIAKGVSTKGTIARKIEKVGKGECVTWLDNQFGTGRGLKEQTPLPLRVVWSKEGPKDDPSMYSRASDTN